MKRSLAPLTLASALLGSAFAQDRIAITVENLAPMAGTWHTPVWVGVHDGGFDLFNPGQPAGGVNSPLGGDVLERLAEDGMGAGIGQALTLSGHGMLTATLPGPAGPVAPGETAYGSLLVAPTAFDSRFLSLAAMVLPSNDAFFGNADAAAYPLYNAQGDFVFHDAFVGGIWDAGTEVNDEVPAHTAFLAQAAPNTGTPEMAPVRPHPGFLAPGAGGIRDLFRFQNALVGAPGYPVAMVRVRRALAVTEDRNYVTLANGDMVMPTVGTPATVRGAFLLRDGGTRLVVRLERRMLANVIGMELRLAQPGGDEAVVLTLAGPFAPGGGPATTMVTEQMFHGRDLTGPLAGHPLDALVHAMEAGQVALLVRTSDGDDMTMGMPGDHPGGEVRGVLQRQ
ncbi:MAG: spondin domain-containing protein [Planctomycetota bacterium]